MSRDYGGQGYGSMIPQYCYKCNAPIIIKKIKVKYPVARVTGKCIQGHDQKYEVLMNQMQAWLPDIVTQILRCDKCGAQATPMSYPKSSEHYMKFYVPCYIHGDREKKIDGPLFPYIDQYYREQFTKLTDAPGRSGRSTKTTKTTKKSKSTKSTKPSRKIESPSTSKLSDTTKTTKSTKKRGRSKKCSNCDRELDWIKEYKRWYCYTCKRYE